MYSTWFKNSTILKNSTIFTVMQAAVRPNGHLSLAVSLVVCLLRRNCVASLHSCDQTGNPKNHFSFPSQKTNTIKHSSPHHAEVNS